MNCPGGSLSDFETSVALADYLFAGEATKDCLVNIKEIFGVPVRLRLDTSDLHLTNVVEVTDTGLVIKTYDKLVRSPPLTQARLPSTRR